MTNGKPEGEVGEVGKARGGHERWAKPGGDRRGGQILEEEEEVGKSWREKESWSKPGGRRGGQNPGGGGGGGGGEGVGGGGGGVKGGGQERWASPQDLHQDDHGKHRADKNGTLSQDREQRSRVCSHM